jgi:hypothetical protein
MKKMYKYPSICCLLLSFSIYCLLYNEFPIFPKQGGGNVRLASKKVWKERPQLPLCDSIPFMLSNFSHPYEVTQLRRRLALSNPACMDTHFDSFAEAFLGRPFNKHIQLHIPKAAGTTLCEYIQEETNITSPGGNCWTGDFCPLWCGCKDPSPTTCKDLETKISNKFSFVMNENWFDGFCDSHTYSMLLREPISRSISHVNHYLDAVAARGHEHFGHTKGWRLSMIQSNYMTWSLTASSEYSSSTASASSHPKYFRPVSDHVVHATSTLERMDFLIDMGMANHTCLNNMLYFLGIYESPSPGKERVGRSNSYGASYKRGFSAEEYRLLNLLDLQVYEHARKLVDVDCDFFARILQTGIVVNSIQSEIVVTTEYSSLLVP